MTTYRTVDDLRPVLYNPKIDVEGVVYEVTPLPNGEGNTTVLHPLMLGQEYPKTYGHYHVPPHEETYAIKSGSGLVLIQKVDETGQLVDFKQVTVKSGDIYTVPAGYAHALVNTGQDDLIVEDNWNKAWAEHDYESITRNQGLAYYVTKDESGRPQEVSNPLYKPIVV